jgi:hypothetical protein
MWSMSDAQRKCGERVRLFDILAAGTMSPEQRSWLWTALAASLALSGACGSSSDSEVERDGAAGVSGAAGATGGAGTAGAAGAAGAAGGGACAPRATFTEASHLIVNVTWPPGTASMGGSGQVHLWGKLVFTASGNTLSGILQACGIVLPPTTLTALGGGGMIQIEVPSAAWDAPSMPRFQVDGTQTGWNVGSTLSYGYAALVGFSIADPTTAPWPPRSTDITMTSDAEGDMNAGLTAVPRSGGDYKLPPTSLLQLSRADQVYIVTRQVTAATLTRTACDQTSGSATFAHFNNHVVGCHVSGGDDCSPGETNFIDTNRTIYEIVSATAQTKIIAETATCADVRAALPL